MIEVAAEQRSALGSVARKQVAVEVEGHGDRAVAHVAAEGVSVDAGGDAHARVEVATGVERDAGQAVGLPCLVCSVLEAAGVEWLGGRGAEDQAGAAA